MRAVSVERLVLNVFVGENGVRFVVHLPRTFRGEERFPETTITFALVQQEAFRGKLWKAIGMLRRMWEHLHRQKILGQCSPGGCRAAARRLLVTATKASLSHRGTKGPMPDGSSKSK